jgi:hypothetical protein
MVRPTRQQPHKLRVDCLKVYGLAEAIGHARGKRVDELGDAASRCSQQQRGNPVALRSPPCEETQARLAYGPFVEHQCVEGRALEMPSGFDPTADVLYGPSIGQCVGEAPIVIDDEQSHAELLRRGGQLPALSLP